MPLANVPVGSLVLGWVIETQLRDCQQTDRLDIMESHKARTGGQNGERAKLMMTGGHVTVSP